MDNPDPLAEFIYGLGLPEALANCGDAPQSDDPDLDILFWRCAEHARRVRVMSGMIARKLAEYES